MTDSARIRWAALERGIVRNDTFAGAELTSAIAESLMFVRVDFSGADLRLTTMQANFKMCSFTGANLRGANLRAATFSGCDLRDADFRDADLRGVSFSYVNTGSDNGLTNITGARFEGADLTDATFERVIGHDPTDGGVVA